MRANRDQTTYLKSRTQVASSGGCPVGDFGCGGFSAPARASFAGVLLPAAATPLKHAGSLERGDPPPWDVEGEGGRTGAVIDDDDGDDGDTKRPMILLLPREDWSSAADGLSLLCCHSCGERETVLAEGELLRANT